MLSIYVLQPLKVLLGRLFGEDLIMYMKYIHTSTFISYPLQGIDQLYYIDLTEKLISSTASNPAKYLG